MRLYLASAVFVFWFGASYEAAQANAQAKIDTVETHLALAKVAAEEEYTATYEELCLNPTIPMDARPPVPPNWSPPPASEWHTEPVKVFDNLYFVGSKTVFAWAVTTSDGIILIDSLFDYMVEDEIVNGLKKLGLDPAKIKYVVLTHAHADHYSGSWYLQERFRPHIILSAADWDYMDWEYDSHLVRSPGQGKPDRDMVATDGQKLTLGDTTLTLYITPGHTPGTMSLLIPVKDNGKQHLAALWGGTGFNFRRTPQLFQVYINSVERFSGIVAKKPVDVFLSNHPQYFDGSLEKIEALKDRKTDGPHPFVVGNDSMRRFLQVIKECAKVQLIKIAGSAKR